MYAHPNLHQSRTEPSGEHVLFAMTLAFGVVMVTIILGFFLPVAAAIALIVGVLGIVLAVVGAFLRRLLSDG